MAQPHFSALTLGLSGLAAIPALAQVVPCDTCGSIALQAPLTNCINTAACFSALLEVDQTVSDALAQAEACAADNPEYMSRATVASDALTAYLASYQGEELLSALSRWQETTQATSCDAEAAEAGIDAALGVLTHLFTFGCDGALPRSEARIAGLPPRYTAPPNAPDIAIC